MRHSLLFLALSPLLLAAGFQSGDLVKLRSVGAAEFSPDGSRLAYSVTRSDGAHRPYSQMWIMTLADGKIVGLSGGQDSSGNAVWSPDGTWIAYNGTAGG